MASLAALAWRDGVSPTASAPGEIGRDGIFNLKLRHTLARLEMMEINQIVSLRDWCGVGVRARLRFASKLFFNHQSERFSARFQPDVGIRLFRMTDDVEA